MESVKAVQIKNVINNILPLETSRFAEYCPINCRRMLIDVGCCQHGAPGMSEQDHFLFRGSSVMRDHGVQVIAVRDALTGQFKLPPDPSEPIKPSDSLVLAGSDEVLAELSSN